MPAVDYRLDGGLEWRELSALLRTLVSSGQAVGMNIGIFNPRLDKDGSIARQFAKTLVTGLGSEDTVKCACLTCPGRQERITADDKSQRRNRVQE